MVSDLTLQSRRQYDPGTPLEVPVPDTSLITLLETSARLYPERIAVDYFGATLTYAQLYAHGAASRTSSHRDRPAPR